ncbi:uncharacterized protein K02A2.6-like [Aricia agestis]|uniref:uncharacterized protein K02A2.6-like n=1 Tax=Aricia agestis TaxID=91739 RepID=UPI001C20A4D3|nr:uncharacterized protein K02A2.6-like [Aricia agestis]
MSTAELKKWRRIRATTRAQLTKLENYVNSNETLTHAEIQTRLQSLQESLQSFKEVQLKIESEIADDEFDNEMKIRYEIEEKFTLLKTILLNMPDQSEQTLTQSMSNPQLATNSPAESKPKINFQALQENETFKNFTQRLAVYFLLNNITDAKFKVYTLLSALPPILHQKLYDLCSPDEPINMNFKELTDLLDDYLDPKPSTWALHRFISRQQQEDETIAIYAAELKKLSLNCEFKCHNCKKSTSESFLSLQFIRGLRDSDIRTKILQERDTPPFAKLIQIASAMEMGKDENKNISQDLNRAWNTNAVTSTRRQLRPTTSTKINMKRRSPITIIDLRGKCYRCGKEDHQSNECSALKITCSKCNKKGHLARVCLQRTPPTYQMEHTTSSEESLCDINLIKSEISEKYMIPIKIENTQVNMEFDTRATLSSISLKLYSELKIKTRIFKTDMKFRIYTGEIFKPVGVTYVKCSYKHQCFNGKLYIINQDVDPIFGRSWMKEISINLADMRAIHTATPKLEKLIEEYSNTVFKSDLGMIPNYKAHLNLKEDVQPIFIKPRRIPYALKDKVDKEIDRLSREGVITKIDHSDWGTPIVPVVKPNGSIRLCADYKVTLNKVIKDEQYPIPIIEDIFAEMNGGKFFCTLDITQAYLNMVMDDESAALQTLSTHKGTYKVNRLMFGVKVAPSLWQKFMDQLLQELEGVKCFFDDIIIQGVSEEQLLTRLSQVLQKLQESNLRVNRDKCQFFKRSINYLGHTIDKDGLHKNREKVKAILDTKRPENQNELRTFLGMANYYNKFIPNLATLANPLNRLLKRENKFIWSSECETCFNNIRKEIASDRVLAHFDPKKQ